MKKKLFVIFMAYVTLSCKKEIAKEPTVFENISACVFDSTKQSSADIRVILSDRFDLIDVEGKLHSVANYYIRVELNANEILKVPKNRHPIFYERAGRIEACNMPKELSQKNFDGVRVKLSCRLFYEPLPQQGRSIPSANGYGVELLRIELLP